MVPLLVIDDDRALLGLYHQMLERAGYTVHTATSGEEGIRMFDRGDYALVITDLIMGGLDGNRVAGHIRGTERGCVIPIIGISGTPWRAERHQFDAVMLKPVSMKELVSSVRVLVGVPDGEGDDSSCMRSVAP
ncbi:MAG: response regulator [Desulfobacterales bacterium]|nr:response regulator [Desulfobacterales bacterium]